MNKERYYQIIDEVYKNYTSSKAHPLDGKYGDTSVRTLNHMYPYEPILSQDEFIKKCKIDTEFSKKWGLKIEERELSLEERMGLCKEKWDYSWNRTINLEDIEWRMNNEWNIPTKLITISYNDKTIESYE